jgi:hypothetical protein
MRISFLSLNGRRIRLERDSVKVCGCICAVHGAAPVPRQYSNRPRFTHTVVAIADRSRSDEDGRHKHGDASTRPSPDSSDDSTWFIEFELTEVIREKCAPGL